MTMKTTIAISPMMMNALNVAKIPPAAGLLLVLTRRLPPSAPGIEVLGEHALLTHWLEHTPF